MIMFLFEVNLRKLMFFASNLQIRIGPASILECLFASNVLEFIENQVPTYHESVPLTWTNGLPVIWLLCQLWVISFLYYNIFNIQHTTQNSQNKWTKISDLGTNIFELKMKVKCGLEFFTFKFYQPLQSCCCPLQKICPERLNWPGRLAGNSEGASRISK